MMHDEGSTNHASFIIIFVAKYWKESEGLTPRQKIRRVF